MSRTVLALLVVLALTGVAPVTAVLGFCAQMPCCFTDSAHDGEPVLGAKVADCCTTINCYEAPSHELTVSAKAKLFTATVADALPALAAAVTAPAVRHVFNDASPPRTTSDRLASLSVFLI